MRIKSRAPLGSINWSGPSLVVRRFGLALLLSTLAVLPVLPASSAQQILRAQPQLVEMAATQPQALVNVIVQKSSVNADAESLVGRLGGSVTKDLHIINGFAATMRAQDIPVLASAKGVRWVSLDAPVERSGTVQQVFTTWATRLGSAVPITFKNPKNILSPVGPNGSFGSGGNARGAFTGFSAELTQGFAISKVEVSLSGYMNANGKTNASSKINLTPSVGGGRGRTVVANPSLFSPYTGPAKSGTVYVDVTSARNWQWADFRNDLQLIVDQAGFAPGQALNYDAIGLRVTSSNGKDSTTPLRVAAKSGRSNGYSSGSNNGPIDISKLVNVFNKVVRATDVWNEGPRYLQGQGITVAIVDSGVFDTAAWGDHLLGQVNFDPAYHDSADRYGHGTFVAGIVADNGTISGNRYMGIAPGANLLSIRISDDKGISSMSDVVAGLQWVNDNKATYNIKVVNLSLNSSVYESYMTNPLDAAVEILWFNKVTVVVSAGNNGTASLFPPANDPFVITVGATDDQGTGTLQDDSVASFSARGVDDNGARKPDLVAPGTQIVEYLPDNPSLTISINHPSNRRDSNYFMMSGTSMASPMVAGGAALLLQSNPFLTPDMVKSRLKTTANHDWPGYDAAGAGSGLLDIYAAIHSWSWSSANTGIKASQLLWSGTDPITWGSVNWSSVNWSSVNWSSVNWSSVNWSSVNWSSDYFGRIKRK